MSHDLSTLLDQAQVFFGATSAAEARVYVSLPASERDTKLRGRVEGPRSLYARTLTAPTPLVDRGATTDGGRLAEAIVADPCFWSAESPFLYDVRIELVEGERVVAETRRTFGIRPLGVRGASFVYAGVRWVLRGIERASVVDTPLAEWRESGAAMVVDDPDESLLDEADRVGVLIAARTREMTAEQLVRWSRHASVGVAILDADLRPFARNVVIAGSSHDSSWADVAIGSLDTADSPSKPFIARRPLAERTTLAAARAACDALQRDAAGRIDAAGYIV